MNIQKYTFIDQAPVKALAGMVECTAGCIVVADMPMGLSVTDFDFAPISTYDVLLYPNLPIIPGHVAPPTAAELDISTPLPALTQQRVQLLQSEFAVPLSLEVEALLSIAVERGEVSNSDETLQSSRTGLKYLNDLQVEASSRLSLAHFTREVAPDVGRKWYKAISIAFGHTEIDSQCGK